MEATRDFLRGKQTPGLAELRENNVGKTSIAISGRKACVAVPWDNITPNEAEANAALYAEAHNASNETGMWPLDMVERIKELESALKIVQSAAKLEAAKPGPTFCEELRDALNMVDHVLSKRP